MKNRVRLIFLVSLSVLLLASCARMDNEKYFEKGVSKLTATYRNATISDVSYKLTMDIPEMKDDPVSGKVIIEFILKSKREPLVLDFRVPEKNLKSVVINGKSFRSSIYNGHIIIPEKYLKRSYNNLAIEFIAGDLSLNRNDDFLYTLFVPDRACTAFPCFDQPDIKAHFYLDLQIPVLWEAISNSPETEVDTIQGKKLIRFAPTRPISTYLFAFATGRFQRIEKELNGIKMEMLHRETRPEYVANNADEIFRLHYNSIRWLETYTGIPYPFDKTGFVVIPSFQYGGMEHPGSIYYRASSLFLEPNPTLNEKLSRASLIAHESSHLWFGDLVTMKWFDDVWLKEVFAGFMADKIVNPDFSGINNDLRFLLAHFPNAYSVDRTGGSNPILQKLDNLNNAGSLYGDIIYHKAPIVMKLLEQITGEEGLRKGLQAYLKKYSYSNARWDDLVSILEDETSKPLQKWSDVWVKEAGMPVITCSTRQTEQGWETSYSENDPSDLNRTWPQKFSSMIITGKDTVLSKSITEESDSFIVTHDQPLCIIPDISGNAYSTFLEDSSTIHFVSKHINDFSDPLVRGILWINANENHINKRISSVEFFSMIEGSMTIEPDLQLRDYLFGRLSSVYWNYLSSAEREEYGRQTEKTVWEMMLRSETPSSKRTWYNLYRNIALSQEALRRLEKIWSDSALPGGQKLSIDDQCTLAFTLALKRHPDAATIIEKQRIRIADNDRLQRFDFVIPSVSADQSVRDAFFESLKDPANREHEPWVIEALGYLNHPVVAQSSVRYILPSLEMLEEIKSTGDIFFPGSWINATLGGHHSVEAKEIVVKFLNDHPDYPQDLRLKILQAADPLLRIEE